MARVVSMIAVGLLAFPTSSDASDARRNQCMQNVHEICVGCTALTLLGKDVCPNSIADLVKTGELNRVPVSPYADDKKSASYEFTMPGAPGLFFKQEFRMILVRCKFAGPDGKVTVGYVNGRVATVPADALAKKLNAAKSTPRTWKDQSGKYSTEATFVDFIVGGVKLKKANGKIISVPYSRLSREDMRFVTKLNHYPSD